MNCATTNHACFEKHGYFQEIVFVVRKPFIACLRKSCLNQDLQDLQDCVVSDQLSSGAFLGKIGAVGNDAYHLKVGIQTSGVSRWNPLNPLLRGLLVRSIGKLW